VSDTKRRFAIRPPVEVVKRVIPGNQLASLTLRILGLGRQLATAQSEGGKMSGLDPISLAEYAIIALVLAPLRPKYPNVFVLTNEQLEFEGRRYGGPARAFGFGEMLFGELPRTGVPVYYDKLGNFECRPALNSLLVDLRGWDLVEFLPVVVEDMLMPVTYAFFLLPGDFGIERVVALGETARDRNAFEAGLVSGGGVIYYWLEEPYFQVVLPSNDAREVGWVVG